ncbi:uncharacterized protein LOC134208954 [Armigeres subalbatus]|uniref:uncharacterized protein LOC134208954 n=1 Tax=Armigeres subalbatus TaxID=124917 RepID=UPI002ED48491
MSNRGRSNKGSNAGGSEKGAIGGVQVVVTSETIEPEPSFPGQSCRVCRTSDTEEMVRCDTCLKWYHFTCVGVTQAIENNPWDCVYCAQSLNVPGKLPSRRDGGISCGGTKKKQTVKVSGGSNKCSQPNDLLTPKSSNPCQTGLGLEPKKNEKKKSSKGKTDIPDHLSQDQQQVKQIAELTLKEYAIPAIISKKLQSKTSAEELLKETDGRPPKNNSGRSNSIVSGASNRSTQSLAKLRLQNLKKNGSLIKRRLNRNKHTWMRNTNYWKS